MGLRYSLKDLPCCSEWIDVREKWVFKKITVGIDPFHLYNHHSKTLEKGDFEKHGLSLATQHPVAVWRP